MQQNSEPRGLFHVFKSALRTQSLSTQIQGSPYAAWRSPITTHAQTLVLPEYRSRLRVSRLQPQGQVHRHLQLKNGFCIFKWLPFKWPRCYESLYDTLNLVSVVLKGKVGHLPIITEEGLSSCPVLDQMGTLRKK
jgi:hypothetical protein